MQKYRISFHIQPSHIDVSITVTASDEHQAVITAASTFRQQHLHALLPYLFDATVTRNAI